MAPSRPSTDSAAGSEDKAYLRSLAEHGRVIRASDERVALPEGVTHVLVRKPGEKDRLVEKRKTFF